MFNFVLIRVTTLINLVTTLKLNQASTKSISLRFKTRKQEEKRLIDVEAKQTENQGKTKDNQSAQEGEVSQV